MSTKTTKKLQETAAEANVNQYTFTPKSDIWETESGYKIEVEMPGVASTGVDVKLEDGVLSIIGQVQPDASVEFDQVHTEYEVGSYERQFKVSDAIDDEKIVASIKNGVLELELPKRESAKPKRIAINVG